MDANEHAHDQAAGSGASLRRLRAWIALDRKNLAAFIGAVAVVLLLLASFIPAGGGVSRSHLEAVIDASFHTKNSSCVGASHGRDLCTVAAGKCTGKILVAPVSSGSFTVVSATPDSLAEQECDQGESVAGEAE